MLVAASIWHNACAVQHATCPGERLHPAASLSVHITGRALMLGRSNSRVITWKCIALMRCKPHTDIPLVSLQHWGQAHKSVSNSGSQFVLDQRSAAKALLPCCAEAQDCCSTNLQRQTQMHDDCATFCKHWQRARQV